MIAAALGALIGILIGLSAEVSLKAQGTPGGGGHLCPLCGSITESSVVHCIERCVEYTSPDSQGNSSIEDKRNVLFGNFYLELIARSGCWICDNSPSCIGRNLAIIIVPDINRVYSEYSCGSYFYNFRPYLHGRCRMAYIGISNLDNAVFHFVQPVLPDEAAGCDKRPSGFFEAFLSDPGLHFRRIGLSMGFGSRVYGLLSGLPRFLPTEITKNSSSDSTPNGQESEDRSYPPVEPLLAVMIALFGMPMYLYGVWRTDWRSAYPGFLIGAIGLGMCIADLIWWLGPI